MDLETVTETLYAAPRDEFVGRRNELAAQARREGDRALAEEIKNLRKPTTSAWLMNRLARRHPGDLDRLGQLGAKLRKAHAELAGDQLRLLSRKRQELIQSLLDKARAIARDSHDTLSDSVATEVEATLAAALVDPDVAGEVRAGRLAAARTSSSDQWLTAALAASAPPRRPAVRESAPRKDAARERPQEEPAQQEQAQKAGSSKGGSSKGGSRRATGRGAGPTTTEKAPGQRKTAQRAQRDADLAEASRRAAERRAERERARGEAAEAQRQVKHAERAAAKAAREAERAAEAAAELRARLERAEERARATRAGAERAERELGAAREAAEQAQRRSEAAEAQD